MKARTILAIPVPILLLLAIVIPAEAQTTEVDFQQAVAAYQQSSTLPAAEKVIRLAAAMPQLPPIPEEARKHFVRGTALFKDAKSPEDYKQVVDEFTQAMQLAPWWPDARYNFALALEAAGDYASAILNVKLYLLFKLSGTDARIAQDKIYALEAKQEKAAKGPSPATLAQQQQDKYKDWLGRLDGARFSYSRPDRGGTDASTGSPIIAQINVIVIRGNHAIHSWSVKFANGNVREMGLVSQPLEISGSTFIEPSAPGYKPGEYAINNDGAFISYVSPSGEKWIFARQ